ncbi:MAG: hypothetical protein AAB554_02040 [Patescibacteria group bacterium]
MTAIKLDPVVLYKLLFEASSPDEWRLISANLKNATCVVKNAQIGPVFDTRYELLADLETPVTLKSLLGMDATADGLTLIFAQGEERHELVLSKSDKLSVDYACDSCDTVVIHGPKTKQEHVKKAEGGGMRTVGYIGPLLTLRHQARYNARLEAMRKADEAARAETEARRKEEEGRVEAARQAYVQAALETLLKSVRGAIIEDAHIDGGGGVVITFSDGRKMTLDVLSEYSYGAELSIDIDGAFVKL